MQCLLQRLHENDEAAFEEVYHLLHQKIFYFILRYVQDNSIAQELTQCFFIKLWDKRSRLSLERPLEAQAFVMARNLVIDELRKMARANGLLERFRTRQSLTDSSPEEQAFLTDLQEQFEAAVESLPERRREIYKLSRHRGLTYQEIATELSISPKTVEAQMSKAMKVVRAKLSAFLHTLL